jgi:hypothetical protein
MPDKKVCRECGIGREDRRQRFSRALKHASITTRRNRGRKPSRRHRKYQEVEAVMDQRRNSIEAPWPVAAASDLAPRG